MFPSKFLQFPSILTHFHAANENIQNGVRDLAISRGLVWVKTWWCYDIISLVALLTLCEENPPVTGRFPSLIKGVVVFSLLFTEHVFEQMIVESLVIFRCRDITAMVYVSVHIFYDMGLLGWSSVSCFVLQWLCYQLLVNSCDSFILG